MAARPHDTASSRDAVDGLARLLETPHLARVVPGLAPETLHALIERRGLDACGELITAATPEQLTAVLDIDLWRPTGGVHDRFDADRFGEWVEMLLLSGESAAARTVATIDASLLVAGLSRHVRIFDVATLEPTSSSDDEMIAGLHVIDPSGGDAVTREVGGYLVVARLPDGWDAIVALLVALAEYEHACFDAVMRGCRRLSNSAPEVDGLDELLAAPDQHLHDVAGAREQRRTQRGYVTAADARAFLRSARLPRRQSAVGTSSMNPVAAAYFREADAVDAATETGLAHQSRLASPEAAADRAWIDAVNALLADAENPSAKPRALLSGTTDGSSLLTPIGPLLERVHDADVAAFAQRHRELAFLANSLVAGCTIQSRPFTPQEASTAAVAICNLGIEHWPAHEVSDTFLADHDLIAAFEAGWSVVHEQVGMFAAEHLLAILADLQSVDADIEEGLKTLRRDLLTHCRDRSPWLARGALDVIAMLDAPAWASMQGLLDECPILPDALRATLERRTGPISPTAFEFIATTKQIREVHNFVLNVLDVLLR